MYSKKEIEDFAKSHNEKIEKMILSSDLSNYDKLELLGHSSDFVVDDNYSDVYYEFKDLIEVMTESYIRGSLFKWFEIYEYIEKEMVEKMKDSKLYFEKIYYDVIMTYRNNETESFEDAKKRLLEKLFNSIVEKKEMGFHCDC